MPIEPFVFAVAAAISVSVSYCACVFLGQSRKLLDTPNERSSHVHATPRTGGVAIIGGWAAGLVVMAAFAGDAGLAGETALLGLCGLLAFGVGLADDKFGLAPVWKLAGQVLAAAVFVAVFGPLPSLPAPCWGEIALPPAWGVPLTILWIVAFMNAFNFMDGANGLAGGVAAAGLAWFSIIAGFLGAPALAAAALLLAVAAAGFLPHNLRAGKLFMGDNGSLALGFLIAASAALGVQRTGGVMPFLIAPVIFLPFLFDVGWTIVSRMMRGQNIFRAHREHLYQLLIRSGLSHARAAILYIALVSLCAGAAALMLTVPPSLQWLAPLALCGLFSVGAAAVYARAMAAGLLARRAPQADGPQTAA